MEKRFLKLLKQLNEYPVEMIVWMNGLESAMTDYLNTYRKSLKTDKHDEELGECYNALITYLGEERAEEMALLLEEM